MSYYFAKTLKLPFDEAIARVPLRSRSAGSVS